MIKLKKLPPKKTKVRYVSKRKSSSFSIRESALAYGLNEEAVYNARLRGELLASPIRFRVIDAFAGAGGKTLGFSEKFSHAFVPVWANDIDEDCTKTYNVNFGDHCVCGDIFEVLRNPLTRIPKADVVVGGPPCQGFSNLNQQKNDGVDPRRALWRAFMEILERAEADVFVMENVPHYSGYRSI